MPNSYDRIARLYDADMGARMAFDDVGFYTRLCLRSGPAALEVGCGTGRVTLPLMRSGIDVLGIDASFEMLALLRSREPASRVAAMDMRRLALRGRFDAILCPYSVITYAHAPEQAGEIVGSLAGLLRRGGRLAIDAFVPRATPMDRVIRDYRIAFENGFLERHKTIHAAGGGAHRIARRYSVQDAAGTERECIETVETIRPYTPEELCDFVRQAGCAVEHVAYDYGGAAAVSAAQHATVVGLRS